jgi:hypothetical protein
MRALILACSLAACEVVPPPVVSEPGETCDDACENLALLGCPEAKGSPGADGEFGTSDDETCVDSCEAIQNAGVFRLNTACVAKLEECDRVDSCTGDNQ